MRDTDLAQDGMKNSWIENGTNVIVKMRNGKVINGTIAGGDYNVCTFGKEYDVNFFNEEKGCEQTLICVPEKAITIAA